MLPSANAIYRHSQYVCMDIRGKRWKSVMVSIDNFMYSLDSMMISTRELHRVPWSSLEILTHWSSLQHKRSQYTYIIEKIKFRKKSNSLELLGVNLHRVHGGDEEYVKENWVELLTVFVVCLFSQFLDSYIFNTYTKPKGRPLFTIQYMHGVHCYLHVNFGISPIVGYTLEYAVPANFGIYTMNIRNYKLKMGYTLLIYL